MKLANLSLVFTATWLFAAFFTIAILYPGTNGDFFFDDEPNIVRNESVQIKELSIESLIGSISGPTAGPLGRPVSAASFALTYFYFGLDPKAFKVINLGLHILNGLLVAWLTALLLKAFKPDLSIKEISWLSIWVSAVWMAHPINVLPVLLAVQRMALLSSLFLLLALICHIKAIKTSVSHKWLLYALGWALFWPLAVFSKETGLLFPVYVLVLHLFLPSQSSTTNKKLAVLALVLFGIGAAMHYYLGKNWLANAYTMRPFSLAERLMTESRVLWLYASQILIPDYTKFAIFLDDFSISRNLLAPPSTLFSIAGWLLVCVGILYSRTRMPLLGFSFAWFLAGHSLESSFLPLEIAHEYRNYLPSIGLILAAGFCGMLGLQNLKLDYKKIMIGAVGISAILILGLFSSLRAKQLENTVTWPQIEATRHPLSARSNYSAALVLFRAGYGDKDDSLGAQQIKYYFAQAGQVDTYFKQGHLGLITWSCASSRTVDPKWIQELGYRLNQTSFSPNDRKMPDALLEMLLNMPACLSREKVLELFMAGANNRKIDSPLRAKFFEAASDYELLVSLDPVAARNFLEKAVKAWPQNVALRKKLNSYRAVKQIE